MLSFSLKAVDILSEIGIDGWKIASGEITNIPMLEKIAKKGRKIFLSTGMSNFQEIENALSILKTEKNEVIVMQCTSEYPSSPENTGLNVIKELQNKFGKNVGFSDHSGNIYSGLAAITNGATAVEAHITFNKNMFGPDVSSSLDPMEFKMLVDGAKWISRCTSVSIDKNEYPKKYRNLRKTFMKSLVTKKDLEKGHKLKRTDLSTKKPLKGIPAKDWNKVIGSTINKNLKKGNHLMWDDLID